MTRNKVPTSYGFGRRMRRMLAERDMAQSELAESLGVSSAYVSLVLKKKAPSAATVDKIASACARRKRKAMSLHRAAAMANGFRLNRSSRRFLEGESEELEGELEVARTRGAPNRLSN
jgi:transcriptional regulator with XRE-family HTH domain